MFINNIIQNKVYETYIFLETGGVMSLSPTVMLAWEELWLNEQEQYKTTDKGFNEGDEYTILTFYLHQWHSLWVLKMIKTNKIKYKSTVMTTEECAAMGNGSRLKWSKGHVAYNARNVM